MDTKWAHLCGYILIHVVGHFWVNKTSDTHWIHMEKNQASAAPFWRVAAAAASPNNLSAAGTKDIVTLLHRRLSVGWPGIFL